MGGWSPVEKIFHLIRRRRWTRSRIVVNLEEYHKKQEVSLFLTKRILNILNKRLLLNNNSKEKKVQLVKEGWEYSKLFSTKFHSKEDSLDTVRRRRWHRPMQPVDNNANLAVVFCFENEQVKNNLL